MVEAGDSVFLDAHCLPDYFLTSNFSAATIVADELSGRRPFSQPKDEIVNGKTSYILISARTPLEIGLPFPSEGGSADDT